MTTLLLLVFVVVTFKANSTLVCTQSGAKDSSVEVFLLICYLNLQTLNGTLVVVIKMQHVDLEQKSVE